MKRTGETPIQLTICTYPMFCGTAHGTRSSYHRTAAEAIEHLDSQTEPYAYAYLNRYDGYAWQPCQLDGSFVGAGATWERRRGTNGYHPAYVAFKRDVPALIREIRQIQARDGGGTLNIALKLIELRHPDVSGWAESLAWAAVSSDNELPGMP